MRAIASSTRRRTDHHCLSSRPPRFPLVAQEAHDDLILPAAVTPGMLPETALFDESAGAIGANRSFVGGERRKHDAMAVAVRERVIAQQDDGFAPVASAPVLAVADANAELAVLMGIVEVTQSALADDLAVCFDHELGATALLHVLIELRLQRGERLRRRRIAAAENLEFQVVVKRCERGQVFSLDAAQRHQFAFEHVREYFTPSHTATCSAVG